MAALVVYGFYDSARQVKPNEGKVKKALSVASGGVGAILTLIIYLGFAVLVIALLVVRW